MATKTASETNVQLVDLSKIVSNTAQSRGMGVLYRLVDMGYGLFEKGSDESKKPIWDMLNSEQPEEVKEISILIQEHEPELIALAEGLAITGQLQPIGLLESDDGTYDIVYGARRATALMCNYAVDPDNAPKEIEAKVYTGRITPVELKLMAFQENTDRTDESPIDRALTYKFLQSEGKMTAADIGKKTGQSGQNVTNYMKLLDKKLEDKRMAIHSGIMTVDRALKLLAKRKKDSAAEDEAPERRGRKRSGLPGGKAILKIYEGHRPKDMVDKEWEMIQCEEVRKWLAYRLGLKFKPYVPLKEEPKPEKGGAKAAAPSANGAKTTKVLSVKKERAIQLLISLGKTQARTWDDKKLQAQLENIVALVEEGQQAENASLQGLLDKLVQGYKDGVKVKILTEK